MNLFRIPVPIIPWWTLSNFKCDFRKSKNINKKCFEAGPPDVTKVVVSSDPSFPVPMIICIISVCGGWRCNDAS